MTKRDHELIARVVATITDDQTRWAVADAFAKTLRAENPRFNIVTFMRACRPYNADTYTNRKERYHAG